VLAGQKRLDTGGANPKFAYGFHAQARAIDESFGGVQGNVKAQGAGPETSRS